VYTNQTNLCQIYEIIYEIINYIIMPKNSILTVTFNFNRVYLALIFTTSIKIRKVQI